MHTCAVAEGGITVDKSRTTVFFFRFLLFGCSSGGGPGAPVDSVGGPACRSAGVESLWPSPAFFLFFFFFALETGD